MFEWLIQTYTYPCETVLDNCIGSGTTAAACEATGRRWVGIEMDEEFCEVTKKRLKGLSF
jgi:site-specific DNA-methyltransferase (adenine-specific)